jgi:hypothetical protein
VSGNCGEITKIFVPYKMILGDVKNPEFRSARAKAFSHKLVEAARKSGVYDPEVSKKEQ